MKPNEDPGWEYLKPGDVPMPGDMVNSKRNSYWKSPSDGAGWLPANGSSSIRA